METLGIVAMITGFWAVWSVIGLVVFGEDLVENDRCGLVARARIQMAAIIGSFPIVLGVIWMLLSF